MNASRPSLLPTIKRDVLSPGFSKGSFFPAEVNSEIEEVQERTDSMGEGTEGILGPQTSFPLFSSLKPRRTSAIMPWWWWWWWGVRQRGYV